MKSEEHLNWNIVELLSVWASVPCYWSAQLDFTGMGLIMYILTNLIDMIIRHN